MRAGGPPGNLPARLDLQRLEDLVHRYFTKGLAAATQRTYRSGQERYIKFCGEADLKPFPVNETGLYSFVAQLADLKLRHHIINTYLSGVRHLQISKGLSDPFHGAPMPRLQYVLRGIKEDESERGVSRRQWLPIEGLRARVV